MKNMSEKTTMLEDLSVNQSSLKIARYMIDNSKELGVKIKRLKNNTTVIDAGVEAIGGLRAGILVAKASLGDLADVSVDPVSYSNVVLPTVKVATDYPVISLLVCQQPLPTIEVGSYWAITSGPGKALMRRPEEFFKISGYHDRSKVAVFILQSKDLPDEKTAEYLAKECKIKTRDLFLITVQTNSIAGVVQVAARLLENPLWRLSYLGFNVNNVSCAIGSAPLSPIYPSIWKRPGITADDMILYGGRVVFFAEPQGKDDLGTLVKQIVTENSPLRGKAFFQILSEAGGEFKNIDRRQYTCARATIYDTSNGKIYTAGQTHLDMIKKLSS